MRQFVLPPHSQAAMIGFSTQLTGRSPCRISSTGNATCQVSMLRGVPAAAQQQVAQAFSGTALRGSPAVQPRRCRAVAAQAAGKVRVACEVELHSAVFLALLTVVCSC